MSSRPTTLIAGVDLTLHGNLLGPAVHRDIADLNRQFLRLSLEPELREDPRFALPGPARAALASCRSEVIERLARRPVSLFQVSLPGSSGSGAAVADHAGPAPPDGTTAAKCHSFALQCLSVARQLAQGAPFTGRLAMGLSAPIEARLPAMSPSELASAAGWPGSIRPRWPRHEPYWGLLVCVAQVEDQAASRSALGLGLCLLAPAPTGPAATSLGAGRRRARAVRGWPQRGLSC